MNKILKTYRIKKRWYYNSKETLKYATLPVVKGEYVISGTIKSLKKKKLKKNNNRKILPVL